MTFSESEILETISAILNNHSGWEEERGAENLRETAIMILQAKKDCQDSFDADILRDIEAARQADEDYHRMNNKSVAYSMTEIIGTISPNLCICGNPHCLLYNCCHGCGTYVGETFWEGVPTYTTKCKGCLTVDDRINIDLGGDR